MAKKVELVENVKLTVYSFKTQQIDFNNLSKKEQTKEELNLVSSEEVKENEISIESNDVNVEHNDLLETAVAENDDRESFAQVEEVKEENEASVVYNCDDVQCELGQEDESENSKVIILSEICTFPFLFIIHRIRRFNKELLSDRTNKKFAQRLSIILQIDAIVFPIVFLIAENYIFMGIYCFFICVYFFIKISYTIKCDKIMK